MQYENQYADTSHGDKRIDSNHESQSETYTADSFCPVNQFYSVDVDESIGLKEKIADVHGEDSRQIGFVGELEGLLGDSKKYRQASRKFNGFVRNHIKVPHNTEFFVDEFINSGYIAALESLRAPNSDKQLDFFEDYAKNHGMTSAQAMLFGPNGTARQSLSRWLTEEALRGQHRSSYKPVNEQMAEMFDKATYNTYHLPQVRTKDNDKVKKEIADDKNKLPVGIEGRIREAFGRQRQLCQTLSYKGTKRLSGDLPYQILEALTTELLVKQDRETSVHSQLEEIIENANASGKDAFSQLYHHAGTDKKVLRSAWNDARKILNDYAVKIWKKRNNFCKTTVKMVAKELPGTIYLNGSRYYWLPKTGEKTIPLIPEKDKNKLPGSLLKNEHGGYYWLMTRLKFRRRLVEPGKKVATKDLKTAQKLQLQEWEKIQKKEPKLADKLKKIRKWGVATKHKPTAVKTAKKLWKQIQENNPDAVARILSDKRPEISKPDIDRVWPGWKEEKARLARAENKKQMPVVYPKRNLHAEWKTGLRVPAGLEAMVGRMKKVDWIRDNTMLVFDDNSPVATKEIAIQSKGRDWADKQYLQNKQCVIRGSASMDTDTGRVRFTVFDQGYGSERTLAEEVYHIVLEIIRQASPDILGAVQSWHNETIADGSDSTLNISEAFSQVMAGEELGQSSSLPPCVVKYAKAIFSEKSNVGPCVINKVKDRMSAQPITVSAKTTE